MACGKCLAKHLSKASVEYSEVLEDASRYTELSFCIGDLACAEDHASALGWSDMKDKIRSARESVYSFEKSTYDDLVSLASEAVGRIVSKDKDNMKFAMEMAKARAAARASEDSNDVGAP
jgi:hypothetical protein